MSHCACGAEARPGQRECGKCFRERVASVGVRRTSLGSQRRWDANLDRYAAARAEGIQPRSITPRSIDAARRISDDTQRAFRADQTARATGG